MDFATYSAIPAVNWSTLRELARSPQHYRHRLSTPRADSPAMRLGRARHARILEPERYADEVAVWAGERRGNAWLAFKEACAGREILTVSEAEEVEAIATAVYAHPTAASLLTGGAAERVVTWTDAATGLDCKARLDYLRADAIVDLKTTKDASPRTFGRNAYTYGYHSQVAFYADGLGGETSTVPRRCYLIAVESEAPHAVAVYEVGEDALAVGRREYRRLLTQLAECRAADEWPGYGDGVSDLWLPDWAYGDGSDLSGLGLEAA